MKKSLGCLTPCVAAISAPQTALADLIFNVGAFSDYRYRGSSQTRLKPAIKAGVNWPANGFYAGVWASNIKWTKNLGGNASVEIDLYGGFKGEITKGVGLDIGLLTCQHPSNKLKPIAGVTANTTVAYGAVTFSPVTLKYTRALTDTFANFDSKNSYHLDLAASFDVAAGWMLAPLIGHQRIKGPLSGAASYWDCSLTLPKDFNGLVHNPAVVGTSETDKVFDRSPVNGKHLGTTGLVAGVKYNF
jgi:uncharacterized protein (TIGR02001 family)